MNTRPPVAESLLADVHDIAQAAGKMTLKWFGSRSLEVESKGDGSPVTIADRAAERFIREEIAKRYPGSAIIGEEEGTSGLQHDADLTWIIDPIDGTFGFARGVPLYSTLLAVNDRHGPAVGVVDLPALRETVWAGRGLGAFSRSGPARVSDVASMSSATVSSSEVGRWSVELFRELRNRGANIRGWGDGYGFALAATGRIDAMIDVSSTSVPHPWDFAPYMVIFPEAGGRCTALDGKCDINAPSMFGCNDKLYDELLTIFADISLAS